MSDDDVIADLRLHMAPETNAGTYVLVPLALLSRVIAEIERLQQIEDDGYQAGLDRDLHT